jgi:pimeloyl-ACP methyl ester carboxylesterase
MVTVQQAVSHRWRVPSVGFTTETDDGVRIVGTRLGPNDTDRPAVVMAHGLMGWHRKPRFAVFAELLSHWFTTYPFDLRGHGQSGGVCDYGRNEILDVATVVRRARQDGHGTVLTLGTSLGGIAVLRHGGLLGGVDGVVGISSLAWWDRDGETAWRRRRIHATVGTGPGRGALRLYGVRLTRDWAPPESPEDVIGKISPAPVLLVHGRDDALFAWAHARRLYEAAQDPKRLMLGDGFGHAEDGLTPSFATRLSKAIHEELGLAWHA